MKSFPLVAVASAKEADLDYSDTISVLEKSSTEQPIQAGADLGKFVKNMNTNIGEQEAIPNGIKANKNCLLFLVT